MGTGEEKKKARDTYRRKRDANKQEWDAAYGHLNSPVLMNSDPHALVPHSGPGIDTAAPPPFRTHNPGQCNLQRIGRLVAPRQPPRRDLPTLEQWRGMSESSKRMFEESIRREGAAEFHSNATHSQNVGEQGRRVDRQGEVICESNLRRRQNEEYLRCLCIHEGEHPASTSHMVDLTQNNDAPLGDSGLASVSVLEIGQTYDLDLSNEPLPSRDVFETSNPLGSIVGNANNQTGMSTKLAASTINVQDDSVASRDENFAPFDCPYHESLPQKIEYDEFIKPPAMETAGQAAIDEVQVNYEDDESLDEQFASLFLNQDESTPLDNSYPDF